MGAVAWGLGLRAEEVFGETFLKGLGAGLCALNLLAGLGWV